MEKYVGERFLLELYKDILKNSDNINHRNPSKDVIINIKRYLDRLEHSHNNATNNSHITILKQYYYDKYIVKEKDININNLHYESFDDIVKKQRESLDNWIDYLMISEYPTWTKYWAFQGMLKIGVLDSDINRYNRRTKSTIKPFVECNPEVLSQSIELIMEYVNNKKVDDESISALVETGSFAKIYSSLYLRYNNKRREISFSKDGIWIKYNQGNENDTRSLFESLQGYSTGWCTAGSLDVAFKQINGGDFYVYYTKDTNHEYKIPRIAIRMNGKNNIGEIRGILDNQNIENGLEEILIKKLKSMEELTNESRNNSLLKCKKLKMLSEIVRKTHNNIDLSLEELELLYDKDIIGFGWKQDKRVEDTIIKRFRKKYLLKDIEVLGIDKCIENICKYFKYIPDDIKNKDFCLKALKYDGNVLEFVPNKTKKLCLVALKSNIRSIRFVPEDMLNRKICMDAIEKDEATIKFIPTKYLDRKFYIEALLKNWKVLEYISENKIDEDICMFIVSKNGFALKFVPMKYKTRDLCIIALKSNGYAIKYVPNNIIDKEMYLTAIEQDSHVMSIVPNRYKDREFYLEALRRNIFVKEYIPKDIIDTEFNYELNNPKYDNYSTLVALHFMNRIIDSVKTKKLIKKIK